MDKEKVIVIDFGGQYNQLVARRVRECNVYCEIYSYRTDIETIKAMNPKGIILTGGPNSCYEADSPTYSKELFELGIPVLGLCYGAQLMMHVLGGKVEKAPVREYGKTEVMVDKNSPLFQNVEEKTICWMSHFDYISKTAPGFEIVAHTADCPVAAAENREKNLYAIQFHPEVLHTKEGTKMLHNFVRGVCGCAGTWRMDSFVENTIKEIIEPLRNLFKDEVRKAGLELGIPEHLVFRQPFPGPGLGIRIIGEVNAEKVRIVQDADAIYREEVDKAVAAYKKENDEAPSWMPNQYFAALTNMRSVGVMGDERTYDYAVALRAVNTVDFMTAESAEIPFAVLQTVMSRIINEVRGVNRVFYDLTSKPPGTIEFE